MANITIADLNLAEMQCQMIDDQQALIYGGYKPKHAKEDKLDKFMKKVKKFGKIGKAAYVTYVVGTTGYRWLRTDAGPNWARKVF